MYRLNKKEKKDAYNKRMIEVEREILTPLVFVTTGGTAPEYMCFINRLAELIAQ